MLILVFFTATVVTAVVLFYNSFVRGRSLVQEAWSGIDVQLKRRFELIPNFVQTVKAYKEFESATLERLTEMRANAMRASSIAERGAAEGQLSMALANVFAVAEDYPDLKANQSFGDLQKQLVEVEDQIQYARRYYNGAVRDMNIKVQSFPGNMIAKSFGFTEADYFQLDDATERSVPKVSL